jgi:hypothetical protein
MDEGVLEELRGRLTEAQQLRQELAQANRRPTSRRRYLHDRSTREAIDLIGGHDGPVTIICGAGASVEAGLPSWWGLVRDLLSASRPNLERGVRERWADAVLTDSLVAGAAVAQAHAASQEEFRDRVFDRLYDGGSSADFEPGAIAQQVAWWKRRFPDEVTLATFNYDDLLERSLAPHMPARGVAANDPEPAGEALVYHLHGRLYDAERDLDFVLSDDDYARFPLSPRWQDAVMGRALEETLCVFVGLSFTDPNLTRWIHRSAVTGGPGSIALFSRQSSPRLPADVRRELEASTTRRWRAAGVDVVFTDFFGEIAQVLHEAALLREGGALADFRSRAAGVHAGAQRLLLPTGSRRLPAAQLSASRWMTDLVDGVREIARSSGVRFRDEQIGAGLWLADHGAGELTLAASSDRAITERRSVRPVRLDLASQWAAVEAVTRGAAVQRDPDVYASRWRYVRGLPLIVHEDDPGRLVAGALTLTSTRPLGRSVFSRLRREVRLDIDDFAVDHALRAFA